VATLEVTIIFESGARIGPLQAKLLESIQETGSISAAARRSGVPYKRPWIILDSLNKAFSGPLVQAATGGRGGGGAALIGFGADVLERYRRIAMTAESAVADELATIPRVARARASARSR
jgi:molybdate transport system regulatory protein